MKTETRNLLWYMTVVYLYMKTEVLNLLWYLTDENLMARRKGYKAHPFECAVNYLYLSFYLNNVC